MSKPKKKIKKVPLLYSKGDPKNNRPFVVDKGCNLWIYDVIGRDFISNEDSKSKDRNQLIPVIAINRKNAIRKVGQILIKMANTHKILEAIVKEQNKNNVEQLKEEEENGCKENES